MKVAARITAATAVVVALASVSYAVVDLRSRRAERRAALEREARAVATALRYDIEAAPSAFRAPSEAALRELGRRASGWKPTVLPSALGSRPPEDGTTIAQLRRLNAMVLVPRPNADVEAGQYYYDLPIRAVSDRGGEPEVIGMLEIARPADALDATSDDLWRIATLLSLIVGITTVMVGVFAMR